MFLKVGRGVKVYGGSKVLEAGRGVKFFGDEICFTKSKNMVKSVEGLKFWWGGSKVLKVGRGVKFFGGEFFLLSRKTW